MDIPVRKRWRALACRASVAIVATIALTAPLKPSVAVPRGAIAVMPFKLLDTSSEPDDQRADHNRRLEEMGAAMSRELAADRTFASATVVAPGVIASACRTETPDCLLGVARAGGSQFALFGVFHKSSTLIMQLFLSIVAVDGGAVLVTRELSFRGDSDESWRRAKDFVVSQIQEELSAEPKRAVVPARQR